MESKRGLPPGRPPRALTPLIWLLLGALAIRTGAVLWQVAVSSDALPKWDMAKYGAAGARLAHAVKDLVVNAIQAGATNMTVRSKFSRKRHSVVVEISNNGEKVSEELMDDMFSPFTTNKSSGTGLGLANVKSIMASHGGDARLISSTDEETVFELSLLL